MTARNTTAIARLRLLRAALLIVLSSAALLVAGLGRSDAARAQTSVQFERDVWPILRAKCVTCHGPEDQFNNLRLDSKERILRGGKNGRILVPGDPATSPMYVRVSLPADDLDIMPAEGDPLTPAQVDTLRRWIAEGADFGSWTGPGT
ncbi:MAG TPA: c-type cytochrome domain-containing protein [Thermoanaerobaculia bacterium]|nr:c-type cytochrome domain-containing protein [Thermoanaerobaculia bacterium]